MEHISLTMAHHCEAGGVTWVFKVRGFTRFVVREQEGCRSRLPCSSSLHSAFQNLEEAVEHVLWFFRRIRHGLEHIRLELSVTMFSVGGQVFMVVVCIEFATNGGSPVSRALVTLLTSSVLKFKEKGCQGAPQLL